MRIQAAVLIFSPVIVRQAPQGHLDRRVHATSLPLECRCRNPRRHRMFWHTSFTQYIKLIRRYSHTSVRSTSTAKPVRTHQKHRDSATASSYISAREVPVPESNGGGWDPDDSDGMSDTRTVVPDDSISCIEFGPKSKSSKAGSHRSSTRHRSEAASGGEVKRGGRRYSVATLPARSKEEFYESGKARKRSVLSYA